MENKKISVIVPIYNAEKWLSRCLNSILNNSYKNLEVICVNDGSTDGSLELLMEFAQKDKRVVLVDQANGGVSAARNKGLDISTGEYISFVDADDWIHKDFFKIMMDSICETDVVCCGFTRCDKVLTDQEIQTAEKRVFYSSDSSLVRLIKGESCGKVFKRSVIDGIQFPLGVKMSEDKVFSIQVLCNTNSVTMVDCSLYYYYINQGSAVHLHGQDLYPAALEILKIAQDTNNPAVLHGAYTTFLSHRYLNMFDVDSNCIRRKCNQQLKKCCNLATKIMPFNERMKLNMMVYIPLLYRIYRIITDPTMLDWEKNQKYKRREKNCK